MDDLKKNSRKGSSTGLVILHIISFLFMITMNVLAVALPLNGKTTGELADLYPNLFTPAGITFSIWSVIYIFLAGFIIFQATALLKQDHPSRNKIKRISLPFIISCLANAGWIIAWHYLQVALSVCIMVVLLITLISMHEKLHLSLPWKPLNEKLWLDVPFSLYLGWITIATIANITTLLVDIEWNGAGLSETFWTVTMIGAGTLIGLLMIYLKNNIIFAMVGVWAFYGIYLKKPNDFIIYSALTCMAILTVFIVIKTFSGNRTLSNGGQ
jgi:hypothetical protein